MARANFSSPNPKRKENIMDLFYDILKCFFGYRKENREYRYNSGINYKNSPNGINMLNSPKEVSIHVRIENL